MILYTMLDTWSFNATFYNLVFFVTSLHVSACLSITPIKTNHIFFESINFCCNKKSLFIKYVEMKSMSKSTWVKNSQFEILRTRRSLK